MTPQAEPILELFRATGAYLQGHFRLTSGLHSGEYLQCALVLQYPAHAEELGRLLAGELRTKIGREVGLVVSPALGGLIIGHEVARALAPASCSPSATQPRNRWRCGVASRLLPGKRRSSSRT